MTSLLGAGAAQEGQWRGPSRAQVCSIWHGQLICSVVGSVIVCRPRRPVSLKIGPQTPIHIPSLTPHPPVHPISPPPPSPLGCSGERVGVVGVGPRA